jgi:hypothetical protein
LAIAAQYTENKSLANYLPDAEVSQLSWFIDPSLVARMIACIVLAFRHVQARGVTDHDLMPDEMLLD